MKFFITLVALMAVASAALAAPQTTQEVIEQAKEGQKLDMKEVEKLLQQIEAEEHKPKPDEVTVSQSWQKLLLSFRQMTNAYMNVLNTINKNLGLPKYPSIPGLSEARQDDSQRPLPLRQIRENLSQLQTTAIEVGQMVRRVVSGMGQDGRATVLNQFRRFTDLWSKQLNEISEMLQNAVGSRQDPNATIFDQISRYIEQVNTSIRDFANNIYHSIRNRITPTGKAEVVANANAQ